MHYNSAKLGRSHLLANSTFVSTVANKSLYISVSKFPTFAENRTTNRLFVTKIEYYIAKSIMFKVQHTEYILHCYWPCIVMEVK